MSKLVYTALVLLLSISAQAHPWDPSPCDIGSWRVTVNAGDASEKADLLVVLKALGNAGALLKIGAIDQPPFSEEIGIALTRKNRSSKGSAAEKEGLESLIADLQDLKGVSISCSVPLAAPRLSGSN